MTLPEKKVRSLGRAVRFISFEGLAWFLEHCWRTGEDDPKEVLQLLEEIEARQTASILRKSLAVFPNVPPKSEPEMDVKISANKTLLNKLGDDFDDTWFEEDVASKLYDWVSQRKAEFRTKTAA